MDLFEFGKLVKPDLLDFQLKNRYLTSSTAALFCLNINS